MKKNSILLLSTLAYSSITFSEPYSVSDILNTKIENNPIESAISNSDKDDPISDYCIYGKNNCYIYNANNNFQTLANSPIYRDVLYNGTNNLYKILTRKYGLKGNVNCRIYRASDHTDAEFKNFKYSHPRQDLLNSTNPYVLSNLHNLTHIHQRLGEYNQQVLMLNSSLNRDIILDLIDIFNLNNPEITEQERLQSIKSFQNRRKFIQKSCGEKFILAYDQYLNLYGKNSNDLQKEYLNQLKQKKLEEQQAKEKFKKERELAIKQKDEEERRYKQSMLLATQQKEQKYKAEEEAKAICYRSKKYLMYKASNEIVYAVDSVNTGQKLLQQDDANIKVGGVSNMTQRYRAPSMINTGNQALKKSFAEYKQLGGTVLTPYQVKKITNSPCR